MRVCVCMCVYSYQVLKTCIFEDFKEQMVGRTDIGQECMILYLNDITMKGDQILVFSGSLDFAK